MYQSFSPVLRRVATHCVLLRSVYRISRWRFCWSLAESWITSTSARAWTRPEAPCTALATTDPAQIPAGSSRPVTSGPPTPGVTRAEAIAQCGGSRTAPYRSVLLRMAPYRPVPPRTPFRVLQRLVARCRRVEPSVDLRRLDPVGGSAVVCPGPGQGSHSDVTRGAAVPASGAWMPLCVSLLSVRATQKQL